MQQTSIYANNRHRKNSIAGKKQGSQPVKRLTVIASTQK